MTEATPGGVGSAEIAVLSHTPRTSSFVVGSHHYARELEALGHAVTFLTIRSRWRSYDETHTPETATTRIPPYFPIPLPRRIVLLNKTIRRSPPEILICDTPSFVSVIPALRPRLVVYRPSDDYTRWFTGVKGKLASSAHFRMLSLADIYAPTSEVTMSAGGGDFAGPKAVIPNGVQVDHFAKARTLREGRQQTSAQTAVYVGALDERLSLAAIEAVQRSGVRLIVAGSGPLAEEVRATGAEVVGPVNYLDLPELLASAEYGILPFSNARSNSSRSPMKLYEYLAAGLRVLSTPHAEISTSVSSKGMADSVTFAEPSHWESILRQDGNWLPASPVELERFERLSWHSKASELMHLIQGAR